MKHKNKIIILVNNKQTIANMTQSYMKLMMTKVFLKMKIYNETQMNRAKVMMIMMMIIINSYDIINIKNK